MSDGLNEARAMRIAEVITDYTAIQNQIAQLNTVASIQDPNTAGAVILRQVTTQAQALLGRPIPTFNNPPSPGEQTKLSLQAIIVDAAARRFMAWRLYQRGMAAVRWSQRRNQLLQGRPATSAQQGALSQIDNALRTDIVAVTDARIFSELNQKDVAAGNWTGEMPNLARIQQYIQQSLA